MEAVAGSIRHGSSRNACVESTPGNGAGRDTQSGSYSMTRYLKTPERHEAVTLGVRSESSPSIKPKEASGNDRKEVKRRN